MPHAALALRYNPARNRARGHGVNQVVVNGAGRHHDGAILS
jgi:hypothetical protein